VHDDGVGLASARGRRDRTGHGIRGMHRRASEIGAALDVRSARGDGTTVTLRFGLQPGRTHALSERIRRVFTAPLA